MAAVTPAVLAAALAIVGLLGYVDTLGEKERLAMIKQEFLDSERAFHVKKAKYEAEMKSIWDMEKETMAKLQKLKELSSDCPDKYEAFADGLRASNKQVKQRLADSAAVIEEHQARMERMKAEILWAEMMVQMQPDTSAVYM